MRKESLATHGFALFCFVIAVYLSVGGWMQSRFGLLGITLNQVGILLFPALLYAKILGLSYKKYFPLFRPAWRDVLIITLLTALVIAPVEIMIHFQEQYWPLPETVQTFYEGLVERKTWQEGVFQFFALALIPAICEEFFFRGFLQEAMSHRFGTGMGILMTALFFAAAHANPWYLLYYFILGVFFGWIRVWRNNLSLCILAHLFNNLYSLYS